MSRIHLLRLTAILSLLTTGARAQQTSVDTLQLDAVDITDKPYIRHTPGAVVTVIDSAALTAVPENAATLLRMHSTAYVRSYGQSGSATISVRGTEARHTAVMWRGFNINSASLGLTDLSLIASGAVNGLSLFHGGASSVFGNSSLGGTLVLDQALPLFSRGTSWNAEVSAGSFGNISTSAGVTQSGKDVYSRTSFLYSHADNDFSYVNEAQKDKPVVSQKHSKLSGITFNEDLTFRTGKNGLMTASIWYQVSGREIPPTMMEQSSESVQRDSILRTALTWKTGGRKIAFDASIAWFDEHQRYQDPKHYIDAYYRTNSWLGSAGAQFNVFEKLRINGGIGFMQNNATFDEFEGKQNRQTSSLFAGAVYESNEVISAALNIRKEFTALNDAPFCPSLHIEGIIIKKVLKMHVSGGRNYNLPSMNDLYWKPGGNTELLPEDSWNTEAGAVLFQGSATKPEIGITAYYTLTDNWIKWVPGDGGIYHPENIDKVRCSGMESYLTYIHKISRLELKLRVSYAYTRSTREETSPDQSNLNGKQLIYIPFHTAAANLTAGYGLWELRFDQNVTGGCYTTSDNTDALDGFQVGDLYLSRKFVSGKAIISAFFKVMNIWDSEYQVVAWRPMPGRWFMTGIRLQRQSNK